MGQQIEQNTLLPKVSAPSLEDWAAGLQLQIEFISRKQIRGDLHPGSLLGGLWKPHRRRSAVMFCPLRPVRTPAPARELAICRAVPSWGSLWGQDMPGKGPGAGQNEDRAGLRAAHNRLSTPRGSRGPILKRRCRRKARRGANTLVQPKPRQAPHGWPVGAELSNPMRRNNPGRR